MIGEWISIMIGGAVGSLLRFLLSKTINEWMPENYPWGIWAVNILGCFAMGIIAALFIHKYIDSTYLRAGIMVGVLGGFTTFSSFALDAMTLFHSGQVGTALTYIITSVVLSVIATFIGYAISASVLV